MNLSILVYAYNCFDSIITSPYTVSMGLEGQHTNRNDGLARNEGLAPARNRDFLNADDIESGFHILARMIADFHLRRKGSYKHSSPDEEPSNTPR